MFYVYDVNGLQFSGSMETLELNKRVQPGHSARRLEIDDPLQENLSEQPKDNRLAAYQQMVARDNMIEPLVHIFQIMSSPAVTIAPEMAMVDAWRMLREKNIRQLVITNERMQVQGMLSDRDILRYLNVEGDDIKVEVNHPVSDIINGETISTASVSDIRRVAKVMAFYHLDAMPVVKDTALVGIVTRGDILRGFAEHPRLNLWG